MVWLAYSIYMYVMTRILYISYKLYTVHLFEIEIMMLILAKDFWPSKTIVFIL